MKDQIIKKTRQDIRTALGKLAEYREELDIQNYKSISDVVAMLLRIESKNQRDSRLDLNSANFYLCLMSDLSTEITMLETVMDHELQKKDIRTYRDLLIAYEKLTGVCDTIDSILKNDIRNRGLKQYMESKE